MTFWLRSRSRLVLLILLLGIAGGCASAPTPKDSAATPTRKTTIVFMTDFGTANDAVAICKAVIQSIAPEARIMDITHQVTPFKIEEASRFLFGVTPYYPPGTVFLVVVDPGVGTSRKAVIVKSKKGQFFVVPDNGLVSAVMERDGLTARLQAILASQTANYWLSRLQAHGIPCDRVQELDKVVNDPQAQARDVLVHLSSPECDRNLLGASIPVRNSNYRRQGTVSYRAPAFGEHTHEVLEELYGEQRVIGGAR